MKTNQGHVGKAPSPDPGPLSLFVCLSVVVVSLLIASEVIHPFTYVQRIK